MNKIFNKAGLVFMAIAFLWAGLYMLCAQLLVFLKPQFIIICKNEMIFPVHIIAIVMICTILIEIMNARNTISIKMAIITLILLAVGPRFYLLQNVSIAQTSDYTTYLVNSMSIYENFSVSPEWQLYFGAVAANVPIICGIFALGFNLFGASLSVGLYMNVFFYTGAVVALYFIALRFTGKNPAFLTAAIYALWPNNICYSVSLSSEPMYIFFLFSGLALFIYGLQTRGIMLFVSMFWSGIILGLSQAIRPVTVIFIFSIGLVLLFYGNKKPADNGSYLYKKKLVILSTLLVAYMLTLWGLGLYTSRILPVISKPSYGWSVFEGSNTNTYGQWDPRSTDVQDLVIAQYPLEQVQKVLLEKGIERIKSYDSSTLALLMANKTKNIFGNCNTFYRELRDYITAQPTMVESGSVPAIILAWGELSFWLYRMLALYFIYICFKCLYYILINKARRTVGRLFYMILPICGIMALHLLVTSIERYNYPAIPIMIMICMTYLDNSHFRLFKKRMVCQDECNEYSI